MSASTGLGKPLPGDAGRAPVGLAQWAQPQRSTRRHRGRERDVRLVDDGR